MKTLKLLLVGAICGAGAINYRLALVLVGVALAAAGIGYAIGQGDDRAIERRIQAQRRRAATR